eukprot:maker-scaffold660_size117387-snap-gene-0.33 protein:Tk06673 transcript:maker-scaffold660_size117387-snap-gene-0.33-mRNA-1 annotation:"nefa-interacting nuclear protein nip30"
MSSGFISEKVIAEKRDERQKEWEQVRKADDPEVRPEDPQAAQRSLFDQLLANKTKAQEEWDDKHQLKNQVRGIDDDEAEFLDQVDDLRSQLERRRRLEEKAELESYRQSQMELQVKAEEERVKLEVVERSKPHRNPSNAKSHSNQKQLLGKIVKKRTQEPPTPSTEVVVPAKQAKLGALAGLGDYSSSSEDSDT